MFCLLWMDGRSLRQPCRLRNAITWAEKQLYADEVLELLESICKLGARATVRVYGRLRLAIRHDLYKSIRNVNVRFPFEILEVEVLRLLLCRPAKYPSDGIERAICIPL